VQRGSRTIIVENCLKQSHLWPLFSVYKLTKNMRAKEEEIDFAEWLLDLGNGNLKTPDPINIPYGIEVPVQCNIVDTCTDIISDVFPNMSDPAALAHNVILTPTNDETLKLNNRVIEKLPGEEKVYFSTDRATCDNEEESVIYPIEFLNSITPSGMPPHKLLLKKNSIIMLIRNLAISKGLCNGTRLIVHELYNHVIDAEILTGSNAGYRVLIPRIKLAPSDINLPFKLERTQFPVRPAYSMTINKSQGQTFQRIGLYLPSPVFSHGQLYVAFSRARAYADIHVQISNTSYQGKLCGKTLTQNVVYKEVL
jgi:hypothetical protein